MHIATDYQHLAEFRFQIRRFLHFSADVARQAGIEAQQHQLLLAIKGAPLGTLATIQYLANRLFIQHNSAVELVNRSVKKGLVERQQDTQDLRRVSVHLTPKGEKLLRSLSEHHRVELLEAGTELLAALRPLLKADGKSHALQANGTAGAHSQPTASRNKTKGLKTRS
ncbi:MAG TPA: MarR family transcriptional regulator [Terriglobales bacterium]